MIVGILKEIKTEEYRVSMTPAGVEVIKGHGHAVLVEKGAGVGSGFEDKAYAAAGAEIVKTAKEVYNRSDMVMHVKEPMPSEYDMIRNDQIVFTYFHLAARGRGADQGDDQDQIHRHRLRDDSEGGRIAAPAHPHE